MSSTYRILVTGGAGYIGSVCARELLRAGYAVTVLDNLSTGHRDAVPDAAAFIHGDIGDLTAVAQAVEGAQAVMHFAAKALIPESIVNPGPCFENNVAQSIRLLEAVRMAGIKRFIFSSTAAVYGAPQRTPIDENDPKNPINAYGESKLAFERMLEWYARAYGWTAVCFRYFNACGAMEEAGERHHPETHVIPLILEVARGSQAVFEVYGDDYKTPDGTCVRDYVHVRDLVHAHIAALSLTTLGCHAFNIGTATSYSILQLLHITETVVGKKIPYRIVQRRPGDPAVLCASYEKLRAALAWEPRYSDLETIVSSAWQWMNRP